MKQETGNNQTPSTKRVSIQRSLDGHSFSRPDLEGLAASDEPVEVELILPHTMLVPAGLFTEEAARGLLAANGTPAEADECVVVCQNVDGAVGLVAAESRLIEAVRAKFPKARFTTPLSEISQNCRNCIRICRREALLYIKVYQSGQLQLAEVVPADTEAEVGYLIDRLGSVFRLDEYELRLAGDNTRELRKWIGKRFEKITCE